jgi:hypothetical protein
VASADNNSVVRRAALAGHGLTGGQKKKTLRLKNLAKAQEKSH